MKKSLFLPSRFLRSEEHFHQLQPHTFRFHFHQRHPSSYPSNADHSNMGILEDIKENKITELELSVPLDEVADDSHDFFKALAENTSIETVKFGGDFTDDLRPDARSKLFDSIGAMENIKEVHLKDGLFQIRDIGDMVKRSPSLRALTLKDIVLQGTEAHFNATEAALYGAPNLKEYEMIDCDAAMKECNLNGLERAGQKCSTGQGSISDPAHNLQTAKTA